VALDACAVQAINVTLVVTPTFKWALIAFKVGLDYFFKWAVIYKSQGPKQRFLVAKIRQNAKKEKGLGESHFGKKWIKKTKFIIF
jgi:hypothetical protein